MKFVRPRSIALSLAALLVSAPAFGQNPPARGRGQAGPPDSMQGRPDWTVAQPGQGRGRGMGMGGPGPDDFGRFLFPPDAIMLHQRELGLSDAQKATIVAATQKLESDVVALNWKLNDEHQKLNDLVQATPIDSTATLAQIDRVLDLERQVKRAHISALVRIKNALSPDQGRTLRLLMSQGPERGPQPGGGRGRGRGMGRGEGGRDSL